MFETNKVVAKLAAGRYVFCFRNKKNNTEIQNDALITRKIYLHQYHSKSFKLKIKNKLLSVLEDKVPLLRFAGSFPT